MPYVDGSELWSLCDGPAQIAEMSGELLRLVESQEVVATSTLVDNLIEQSLLENMLETSKPPLRHGSDALHYLLATPFRYPPLRHGSRFGRRHEPSLLYGGHETQTVLAETAYYRLIFWHDMKTPPPMGRLLTQHTLFRAHYCAGQGIALYVPPWSSHADRLTHPSDYSTTQALGSVMRAAGVEAVEYTSARDPHRGVNVGLFTPAALTDGRPTDMKPWLCETRADHVAFSSGKTVQEFAAESFFVAGRLPRPAP